MTFIAFVTHTSINFSNFRYLKLKNDEVKFAWMFLNDCFFDRKVIDCTPTVLACACIYLGKRSTMLYHNRNNTPNNKTILNNASDKWWLRLGVTDDILFNSSAWIADISFCRIQIRR